MKTIFLHYRDKNNTYKNSCINSGFAVFQYILKLSESSTSEMNL